jgi:hypothetical protein
MNKNILLHAHKNIKITEIISKNHRTFFKQKSFHKKYLLYYIFRDKKKLSIMKKNDLILKGYFVFLSKHS